MPPPVFGVIDTASRTAPTVYVPFGIQPVSGPAVLRARVDTVIGPSKAGVNVTSAFRARLLPFATADVFARSTMHWLFARTAATRFVYGPQSPRSSRRRILPVVAS